jgi:hypothetical protein
MRFIELMRYTEKGSDSVADSLIDMMVITRYFGVASISSLLKVAMPN